MNSCQIGIFLLACKVKEFGTVCTTIENIIDGMLASQGLLGCIHPMHGKLLS
jgi:hypothetical protein